MKRENKEQKQAELVLFCPRVWVIQRKYFRNLAVLTMTSQIMKMFHQIHNMVEKSSTQYEHIFTRHLPTAFTVINDVAFKFGRIF